MYAIRYLRKEGQSGLDMKIAVIRTTHYAIRNAGQAYPYCAIRKKGKMPEKYMQLLNTVRMALVADARSAHTFAGPIGAVRRLADSRIPTLDDDSNQ